MVESDVDQPHSLSLADVIKKSGVAFGTSGARGVVSALTDDVCAAYTYAFWASLQHRYLFNRVAIAVDLRPSSQRIASVCSAMLRQLGVDTVFCGAIPTPALALYAQHASIPGIMVTGSHIPFDRNGLKFYRPDGEISKQDEIDMLSCKVPRLTQSVVSLTEVNDSAYTKYIQRYIDLMGEHALANMKLAIYEHSSVARDLMQSLFRRLGAEIVSLARSDTFVPIDTEAVSAEDIERARQWALQYDVDAIISTDGDGDRPLMSDERGHWLRGDIVGLLTAQVLNIQALVVPVSCNTAIEKSGSFRKVSRTRIGSPYVIAGMQALIAEGESVVAGFEANGGFLLGTNIVSERGVLQRLPTRDALLPIMAILLAAKQNNCKISALSKALPSRYTASDRLQHFPTSLSSQLIQEWIAQPSACLQTLGIENEVVSVDVTDGLRITLDNHFIVHLRPSGNAPELRCYVEADSFSAAQQRVNQVLSQLANLIPVS